VFWLLVLNLFLLSLYGQVALRAGKFHGDAVFTLLWLFEMISFEKGSGSNSVYTKHVTFSGLLANLCTRKIPEQLSESILSIVLF
jgi:hypothetical protein